MDKRFVKGAIVKWFDSAQESEPKMYKIAKAPRGNGIMLLSSIYGECEAFASECQFIGNEPSDLVGKSLSNDEIAEFLSEYYEQEYREYDSGIDDGVDIDDEDEDCYDENGEECKRDYLMYVGFCCDTSWECPDIVYYYQQNSGMITDYEEREC